MTAQPNRNRLPQEWERIQHELPPLRVQDALVGVCLILRYAPDGAWRGRLRFITPGAADRETAEIFCAPSEAELWRAVHTFGDHHLRALYQSLA